MWSSVSFVLLDSGSHAVVGLGGADDSLKVELIAMFGLHVLAQQVA